MQVWGVYIRGGRSPLPVQPHVIILIRGARGWRSRIRMHLLYHFLPFLANFGMGAEWQIITTRDLRIELTRIARDAAILYATA